MIKHILKIIWTERKINIWILLELTLVFIMLWFCVDYIYYFTKQYLEPQGFDTEHVYSINVDVKDWGSVIMQSGTDEQKDSLRNTVWAVFDRIKHYPAVEAATLSYAAIPYSSFYSSYPVSFDSIKNYMHTKMVDPDFFKVFKIDLLQGRIFNQENFKENNIIISGNSDNTLFNKDITQVKSLQLDEDTKQIIGIVQPSKRSEFNKYEPVVYIPFLHNNNRAIYIYNIEISVRVKPDMDHNFIEKFTNDMQEQINIDPYYLASVSSFDTLKTNFSKGTEYRNFNSIFSIAGFLLVNIFLAVVGTFWFRVQTRRSEIGLRIALGSSRASVQMVFIQETIILIFLASIVATAISINISLVNVLKDIGIPSVQRDENETMLGQYIINYLITFSILAIISVAAVWYPSRKASRTQPAEALKDE